MKFKKDKYQVLHLGKTPCPALTHSGNQVPEELLCCKCTMEPGDRRLHELEHSLSSEQYPGPKA